MRRADNYSNLTIRGAPPTVQRVDAPKRERPPVMTKRPVPAPQALGEVLGVRWGLMQGWEVVAASTVQPPVSYTFDIGLTLTGTSVNLDPATPTEIGGLMEPPDGALTYVRQYLGGVGTWIASTGTGYTWGIGLDEAPLGSGNIDLIAATATVLGGVSVVARSATQGLDLAASGALTAPLATDLLAGSIVEPPPLPAGATWQRTFDTTAGGAWVQGTAGVEFGTGLYVETTQDPPLVHLSPAGPEARLLGGVWVPLRDATTQGLTINMAPPGVAATGELRSPPATNDLLGVLTEPPVDGLSYARRYDSALPAWVWEPTVTAGLQITGLIPEQVIIPSTTPVTVHAFGSEFTATCEILLDGNPVVPPALLISSTEMTFTMDPTPETAMRSVIVTVRDTVGPVDGAGAESFVFAELVESLYRGRWQPASNAPDIGTLVKDDQWMWIADTVDRDRPELAPATLPGIGGQLIGEGDHIIWDATTSAFLQIQKPGGLDVITTAGRGLSKTGPRIDLQPPGDFTDPMMIGGVRSPPRDAANGLQLDGDGLLLAPLATDLLAGSIIEPPPNDLEYVRTRTAAGVSSWVRSIGPRIAGTTPAEVGIVYVEPAMGLGLNPDGGLTLAPTTPSQIGGIIDAPFSDPADLKSYARQNAAWVEVTTERILVAGDNPSQKGIVYVPDGMGLALQGDGRLTLAPSTPSQVGGLADAPYDSKPYARQDAKWVPAGGTVYTDDAPPPTPVEDQLWFDTNSGELFIYINDGTSSQWVQISGGSAANDPATSTALGLVYVPDDRGLQLGGDGMLTALIASDLKHGVMLDAPALPADKTYVRKFGQWVENTATKSLVPVGRSPINGLDSGFDTVMQVETIFVPLATDKLAGSIVEPPDDGQAYTRTRTGGISAWTLNTTLDAVLVSDTAPTGAAARQLWWDSDSGDLFINYQDADSLQWVQVNVAAPAPAIADDAPTDGKQYARQSSAWSEVISTTGGITQADADARYLQQTGGTLTGLLTADGGITVAADQSFAHGAFHWETDVTWGNLTLLGNPMENIMTANLTTRAVDFFTRPTVLSVPIAMGSELEAANDRIARLEERLARMEAR